MDSDTALSVLSLEDDEMVLEGLDPGNGVADIDAYLEAADIILLLISPSFLNSNYCYDIEMKRGMERHKAGLARLIPVVIRSVDLEGAPFASVQALPKDAKPVTSWQNRDEAWTDVAKGIRKVAEVLSVQKGKALPHAVPVRSPVSADEDRRSEEALSRAVEGFGRQVASAMLQKQLQGDFRPDAAREVAESIADLPDQKRLPPRFSPAGSPARAAGGPRGSARSSTTWTR